MEILNSSNEVFNPSSEIFNPSTEILNASTEVFNTSDFGNLNNENYFYQEDISINENKEICEHQDVDNNNYCLHCGTFTIPLLKNEIDYNKKNSSKVVQKTLSEEVKRLNLPKEILDEATQVLQNLQNKTNKLKNKKKLDFYCLYKAYMNLGIEKNTLALGQSLGLKKKKLILLF